MSNYIKNLINTRGWKEVEKMFDEEIAVNHKDINSDLDDKTLAREIRARIIASDKMTNLLNRIRLSAGQEPKDKITYK